MMVDHDSTLILVGMTPVLAGGKGASILPPVSNAVPKNYAPLRTDPMCIADMRLIESYATGSV